MSNKNFKINRPMYPFVSDKEYTRKDVLRIVGEPEDTKGGPWHTGYAEFKKDFFIFVNIGAPGKTGHDYDNYFQDEYLHWYAKGRAKGSDAQVRRLLSPAGLVYLFYRYDNNNPKFIFAGTGVPFSFQIDEQPVQITWKILSNNETIVVGEIDQELVEGRAKLVSHIIRERNAEARKICIDEYGYSCVVCGFNFENKYGSLGKDFIHVHHITPLSETDYEKPVDPIEDLRPVCPNCHAMLHRSSPILTINELKLIFSEQ